MTPNLTGPMESRLIALERRQARIGDEIRQLQRQGFAIGQGIFDGWGDVAVPTGIQAPPAPTGVTIPGCPNPIPFTLVLVDPPIGTGTATWDGSNWVGCMLKTITYQPHTICNSGASAISVTYATKYILSPALHFTEQFLLGASSLCAVTSDCTSTLNRGFTANAPAALTCSPFSVSFTYNVNSGQDKNPAYGGSGITQTITFHA